MRIMLPLASVRAGIFALLLLSITEAHPSEHGAAGEFDYCALLIVVADLLFLEVRSQRPASMWLRPRL